MGQSPFLVGKSPFSMGKSPFLMRKMSHDFFGTTSQEQLLLDQKDELLSAQTQLRRQMGAVLEAHQKVVVSSWHGIFNKRRDHPHIHHLCGSKWVVKL